LARVGVCGGGGVPEETSTTGLLVGGRICVAEKTTAGLLLLGVGVGIRISK
jgi:hypothetical protein